MSAFAVLNYHAVSYSRVWRGSVLSSFVMPILFVLGFGLSVGSLVDATGRLGPESYLAFIVPGMIASTAMQVAFGESSWPFLARLQWQRIYDSMAATPLRVRDIVAGDLMFVFLRVFSTASVFLGITALFGAVSSWWSLLVPFIAALVGLAFATPIITVAAHSHSGDGFSLLYRFMIVPMSLFAGVFFPVSALAVGLRWLAYISPLYHGVQLCRVATGAASGTAPAALGHVAYLLLWAIVGLALAYRGLARRLAD